MDRAWPELPVVLVLVHVLEARLAGGLGESRGGGRASFAAGAPGTRRGSGRSDHCGRTWQFGTIRSYWSSARSNQTSCTQAPPVRPAQSSSPLQNALQ